MKTLSITTLSLIVALSAGSAIAKGEAAKGDHKGGPFAMMDINKDGVVTKAEFLQMSEKHFAMMDTNGDGKFTKEEAKAGREKMKEKMKKKWGDKRDGKGKDGKHKCDHKKHDGKKGKPRGEWKAPDAASGAANVTPRGENAPESKRVIMR